MTAGGIVASVVDERQARRVAEEAREASWDRPSFAKELYLGRFRPDLIHPFPRPAAADVERGEEFLARLAEHAATIDGAAIEREGRIPADVLDGLRRIGAFGMRISPDFGGLGLSQLHYNRALALIGSVSPAIGALLSAHQSIGVPRPVAMFGTADQQRRFLPRCAVGAISAFLLTEPDVGSDPARLNMRARRTDEGDYVLDGVKLWATNGTIAELLVVLARVEAGEGTNERGGITAFVVEADSPGIEVLHRNAFMGLRGLENSVTRFTGVRVPAANRIGEEGRGLKIALTTLTTGRLSIPAMCVGASKWSLGVARQWARERVQWGRPVGEHAAVAHQIAFMATATYAQESVLELTSLLADAGGSDVRIEAALAKLYTSEMAWQVADRLVQVRGGRGYESAASLAARGERAAPVEQVLRDLRINRIFEGSTEIMHLLIAREAVDQHLSVAGGLIDPDATAAEKASAGLAAAKFYAGWLPTLCAGPGSLPGSYRQFGSLAGEMRFVERASRRLARATFAGMARWQGGLERRQGFLGRVVDIGALLFAMAACCVRAEDARSARLARAYCRRARLEVEQLFTALWRNTDTIDEELARQVLHDEHVWLEDGVIDTSSGTGPWINPEHG